MKNKKSIILAIIAILLGIATGINFYSENENKELDEIIKSTVEEVKELQEEVKIEENQSTVEIPELTTEDEQLLEVQEVEDEGFELQGDIAYEGDRARSWNVELGEYSGLTYYSQIDSRWRYNLFTSTGNKTQTIGSSGCGPTSAAMIVSSIKGNITPDVMADLFVENGYRSANNGTYWSAYRAVADEFDIGYQETSKFDTAMNLLKNNNYLVCSVGNGLFTTGGHYIVIYGIEGNDLKIYDPYLYSGKFETSTRRGKVNVLGNTIYCSISNFKSYANYKQFFCYKYNPTQIEKENSTDSQVLTTAYVRYVKVNTSLNVRSGPGTNYNVIGKKYNGNKVNVLLNQNNWSKIDSGWLCSDYLVSYNPVTSNNTNISSNVNNTAGKYYRLKSKSYIYKNSNLTGTKYTYLAQTQIKVISNITSSIDYVEVVKTGRRGYINTSAYTNKKTIIGVKNTVGNYYRLKSKTTLFSNSNLTGTRYSYLANTKVKIIKNINDSVDYVYIPATNRYAYIKNIYYK